MRTFFIFLCLVMGVIWQTSTTAAVMSFFITAVNSIVRSKCLLRALVMAWDKRRKFNQTRQPWVPKIEICAIHANLMKGPFKYSCSASGDRQGCHKLRKLIGTSAAPTATYSLEPNRYFCCYWHKKHWFCNIWDIKICLRGKQPWT